MYPLKNNSLKGKVSQQEWQTRVDLAACYRLVAEQGWGDLIYTHISARVPNTEHYLVNAFGLTFDEVAASNLVKVDLQGKVLDGSEYQINPAGFTIHSAIHQVRHDAQCVIHLHTKATIAVATIEGGLKPWSQYAMFSIASLSYHDYEGLAVDKDEKARLQSDLAQSNHMLLHNHGGLTLGATVGDAFMRFYDLQRACEIQMELLQSGQPIIEIPPTIVDGIYTQANIVHSGESGGQKAWPAMLRRVYKLDPSFCE